MHKDNKFPHPEDIDKIISAGIPNKEEFPKLYEVVMGLMIHGPCGVSNMKSPCMRDGKCSKSFPKMFQESTSVNEDGYPIYKRRDNENEVQMNGVMLNSIFVVPYNLKVLMKYQSTHQR